MGSHYQWHCLTCWKSLKAKSNCSTLVRLMPTFRQHAQQEICPIRAELHRSPMRKLTMAWAKGLPTLEYWHCQDDCKSTMSTGFMACKFNCWTSGAVSSSVPLLNSQLMMKSSQDGQVSCSVFVIQGDTHSILWNALNTSAATIDLSSLCKLLWLFTTDLTAQMLLLQIEQLWN